MDSLLRKKFWLATAKMIRVWRIPVCRKCMPWQKKKDIPSTMQFSLVEFGQEYFMNIKFVQCFNVHFKNE